MYLPTVSAFPYVDYVVFSEGYEGSPPILLFKKVSVADIAFKMRKGGETAGQLMEFCNEGSDILNQTNKHTWTYNMESM